MCNEIPIFIQVLFIFIVAFYAWILILSLRQQQKILDNWDWERKGTPSSIDIL